MPQCHYYIQHRSIMIRIIQSRFCSTVKIPIEAIKKLRDQTSAPIGQCKTALQQTKCDHQAALAWLKQKGLLQAEKRANKQTREGVIGAMVTSCRSKVALVEVNCETDFVAKNSLFVNFANNLMSRAIEAEYLLNYDNENEHKDGIEAFLQDIPSTQLFPQLSDVKTVDQQLKILISRLQQNIRVRRVVTLHSDKKKYGIYVHQGYDQYVGLQAAVSQFQVQTELDEENQDEINLFGQFADNIATQLLGSPPKYLRIDEIPAQKIAEQTERVKKQMAERMTKAPAHTHQKMILGKLNSSFYEKQLLQKMPYVLSNDGIAVEAYWKQIEDQLNKKLNITKSIVWQCK